MEPVTPDALSAVAVNVPDPAKVGVPVKLAIPDAALRERSDRRLGDAMRLTYDEPKKLAALKGMGVMGSPTKALEKTALFDGVVKTTVSVYLNVRVVEFDKLPENTLVAFARSVFEITWVPSVGVAIVGVPVRMMLLLCGYCGRNG
jgi:hypothetical protein